MKEELKKIPVRFLALLNKIIGIKGLILAVSIVLKAQGKLEDYALLVVFGIVIFGREMFKYLELLRK